MEVEHVGVTVSGSEEGTRRPIGSLRRDRRGNYGVPVAVGVSIYKTGREGVSPQEGRRWYSSGTPRRSRPVDFFYLCLTN